MVIRLKIMVSVFTSDHLKSCKGILYKRSIFGISPFYKDHFQAPAQ